jgi:VWFA-related protein
VTLGKKRHCEPLKPPATRAHLLDEAIVPILHHLHARYSSRRRFLLTAGSAVWARVVASAQEVPTFSAEVKVVNLLATVRDKKGQIIRDLSQDDFMLSENGRPQTIRYFSRESDLPLTLGLLVDTSLSQGRVINAERGASLRFLDQVLREDKDQVFLMQFDIRVRMRQELTSSRRKLNEALAFVDTPSFSQLRTQDGGGTLLYDAVVTAAEDIMRKPKGRKALIVLSDGVDSGSDTTLAMAIDASLRSETLVYSILFSDAGYYGPFGGHEGRSTMQHLAQETGGGFFEVSKRQSIDQIFDLLQTELRSQYSLGFVSDRPVDISEFRKIQLSAKTKGLVVQAQDRYWARR